MSKSKILLTLIMLFIFGIVGIQAQDDESTLGLALLVDGDVVEGVLSSDDQTHLYVFNGNEGDVVTISMTQTSDSLDPFLVLLGSAGEVIASDDDSGTEETFSALIEDIELPATGSYFIVASSFYNISTFVEDVEDEDAEEQTYELAVSGMSEVEDMEDTFTYYHGTLVDGETMTGASTPEEPVYFYIFEGSEGDVISIDLNSEDFDTVLHIFAPGGARLGINDDGGDGTNSVIEGLELPEDGLYLVFATDYFFHRAADEDSSFTGGVFEITLTQE